MCGGCGTGGRGLVVDLASAECAGFGWNRLMDLKGLFQSKMIQ